MSAFVDSAKALVDPVDGARRFVEARRIVLPLLIAAAAVAFSGAAMAVRWDASRTVISELSMSGELTKNTEQEIADKIQTKERTRLVGGIANGVFVIPIVMLLFAAILKFAGWLLGTSLTYVKALSVAVLTFMPTALASFLRGLLALKQPAVTEGMGETLLPSNLGLLFPDAGPKLAKLLSAVDFFTLWGVVLLGFGFAAASGMRRSRALFLAFVLWAMFVGVFKIGLPAMGGGGAR